jgi:drug/metabolite transporter (DMT)-like permease
MQKSRRMGLLMIISGATLWGISGPMIQWLFQNTELTSSDYLIFRLLLAGLFILFFLLFKGHNIFAIWKHPSHRIHLIVFAVLGMLGAQYAFVETVRISNAVTATLFQFLGPVLIPIYIALKDRKLPTLMKVLAVLTAFIGTYFLITNGSVENLVLSNNAVIWGILTALGFTFYTLQPINLIKSWGTMVIVGWGLLIGGIVLVFINPINDFQRLTESVTLSTMTMFLLIILSGTFSFLLYIGSLKYLSATETGILSSIEPLVAGILTVTWLNESFGGFQLIGGGFIILAVILLTMPEKEFEKEVVASERVS